MWEEGGRKKKKNKGKVKPGDVRKRNKDHNVSIDSFPKTQNSKRGERK